MSRKSDKRVEDRALAAATKAAAVGDQMPHVDALERSMGCAKALQEVKAEEAKRLAAASPAPKAPVPAVPSDDGVVVPLRRPLRNKLEGI